MTDRQLHILLDTLRGEVEQRIAEADDLLAYHGADRRTKMVVKTKDGQAVHGIEAIGASLRGELRTIEENDPDGRFLALEPLDTLLADWETRFLRLLPDGEESE